ncbi:uncharacterized protein PAC_04690 [Phialocephala subalpina]|uniref:Uncharacterized protein n=1 Tax=Phialocephala subalpina TaxID=576137 RepID=A0A1L7WPV0_9HELO|nr:uncharacterized protein PAC_04690 [Phialocephala subalpina]
MRKFLQNTLTMLNLEPESPNLVEDAEIKKLLALLAQANTKLSSAQENIDALEKTSQGLKSKVQAQGAELVARVIEISIVNEQCAVLETRLEDLGIEIKNMRAQAAKLQLALSTAHQQISLLHLLTEATVATRSRLFLCNKRTREGFHSVSCAEDEAIRQGNIIGHDGHWKLDVVLARMGKFSPEVMDRFKGFYGVAADADIRAPLAIEVLQMNAKMVSCLAGTARSHNQANNNDNDNNQPTKPKNDDDIFHEKFHEFGRIHNRLQKEHGNDYEGFNRALEANAQVKSHVAVMRLISGATSRKHHEYLFNRQSE